MTVQYHPSWLEEGSGHPYVERSRGPTALHQLSQGCLTLYSKLNAWSLVVDAVSET